MIALVPQDVSSLSRVTEPLSALDLLRQLVIGFALALAVVWHFRRFGSTLSNRTELGRVIPFVMLTTILLISVVKSSIALSLGLVGALSIVRFRTPIKEPEELAYLFVAIAIGVGLGAQQTLGTVFAGLLILVLTALPRWMRRQPGAKQLYLSVELQGEVPQNGLRQLGEILGRYASACDLRRFDVRNGVLEATYAVDVANTAALASMSEDLRRQYPTVGLSFLDQSRLPSV